MIINIIGASGSGTTTLGKQLASTLGYTHLDSDQYFWEKTVLPFEEKREASVRNTLLKDDLEQNSSVVLSGPIFHWGDNLTSFFDVVIFLYVPQAVRMQRLEQREKTLYGSLMDIVDEMKVKYNDFMLFASRYEDETFQSTRTLHAQNAWLNSLTIPVIRVEGDYSVNDVEKMEKIKE